MYTQRAKLLAKKLSFSNISYASQGIFIKLLGNIGNTDMDRKLIDFTSLRTIDQVAQCVMKSC